MNKRGAHTNQHSRQQTQRPPNQTLPAGPQPLEILQKTAEPASQKRLETENKTSRSQYNWQGENLPTNNRTTIQSAKR